MGDGLLNGLRGEAAFKDERGASALCYLKGSTDFRFRSFNILIENMIGDKDSL